MKIDTKQLAQLMLEVANHHFGAEPFKRRDLMVATEQEVRSRQLWTLKDDVLSESVDPKSAGLADIDYRVSDLARWGEIEKVSYGVWRLKNPKEDVGFLECGQVAHDLMEPPPTTESVVRRIIRDSKAAKDLKHTYEYRCQVCGVQIEPTTGKYYIEVHHLRPLGGGHSGPDLASNMIVLCPNHHAMFDLGMPQFTMNNAVELEGKVYDLEIRHEIAPSSIEYHNDHLHANPA
jgi:putative restriction endonuclease